MNFDEIYDKSPYEMEVDKKERFILNYMKDLSIFHYEHSVEYKAVVDAIGIDLNSVSRLTEIPFMPVRMFKVRELCSVPKESVIRKMTSSGTTNTQKSIIFLDKETAANQQRTMIKIVSDFVGKKRLPMLIIDSKKVLRDRNMLAVRGAAILGFSFAGRERIFALNDDMTLNLKDIKLFLEKYKDETILIFGFTSMIWQYLYERLDDGVLNLSNSILIHGGGWKKLEEKKISNEIYKGSLKSKFGIDRVCDYYGMVEQTGCIYMECEYGHLHVSIFSDVIIRKHEDFSVAEIGQEGLIQVISTIPKSYPGHSILTEDRGVILGHDDCPCGRKGKYFKILGRISKAEIRGCSDAY